MIARLIQFILNVLVLLLFFQHATYGQVVRNGYADLRNYDFSGNGKLKLDGEWLFHWKKFVPPDRVLITQPDGRINVPGNWFSYHKEANIFNQAYGYGTYVLLLSLPNEEEGYALKLPNIQTAYILYVDGEEKITRGNIGYDKQTSAPNAQTGVVFLPRTGNDTTTIAIHVSNFHFSSTSGIWSSIEIGPLENIVGEKTRNYFISSFLIGSLLIMGLYHIAIFLMRKKDVSAIYFSIICIAFAVRELFSGEIIVFDIFPHLSWVTAMRILILCFPIAFYFFCAFLWSLYPQIFYGVFRKIFLIVCLAFALSVIVLEAGIYMQLLLLFALISTVLAIYVIIRLFSAVIKKLEGSEYFLLGSLVLILSAIHDTLVQAALINGTYILPIAFFIFILFQSLVLAVRFTKTFKRVEQLSQNLILTNRSYARFVPKEFSNFLNRNDITEVQLGDAIETNMTVLFADIRGFTTLAEKMSPQDTFQFINKTLGATGPLIRKHHGFIDKYIGDAIMAIFPRHPEDALMAAIEIQQTLKDSIFQNKVVQYGIGIHTGKIILGIIGEPERIESTVISDAVNIASRIEGLTRQYNVGIIVTEDVIQKISRPTDFQVRFLDTSFIKGRDQQIKIYELNEASKE